MHQEIIEKLRYVMSYLDEHKLAVEAAYISLVIERLTAREKGVEGPK